MKVIGLISGTSTDGIDAALVDVTGGGIDLQLKLIRFEVYPYPRGVRRKLLELSGGGTVADLCHLNFVTGELFAQAALRIAAAANVDIQAVDVIGSHGQTVCHLPRLRSAFGVKVRSTLQIGEPAVIAERTGVTTVADFRPRDIAAGGQGAPLTPYFHYILFRHSALSRLVVNIGGISNMTLIPAGSDLDAVQAFDTGPGNMLIDGIVQMATRGRAAMDRDGRLAKRGRVHSHLLSRLMAHPFIRRPPPKSTGREAFGRPLITRILQLAKPLQLSTVDLIATVTAFTARSLAYHYRRFVIPAGGAGEIIVGGGGVRNPVLMSEFRRAVEPVMVVNFEHHGLDSKAVEAMAFALLAAKTIDGESNNVPVATGARQAVCLGKIVPGRLQRRPS